MQKKFLSNLILMVFLNLLIKPLAIFGIDAQVQNQVGTEEYGMYFSLFNFTYIFNILLDLGITNYNVKYVAQYPVLVKRYMGKIIPLRLFLFLIYVLFSGLLAIGLGYNGNQLTILGVLVFNQFLVSVILYLRSYFAGLLNFRLDALFSVLDKLLLILICGTLLYHPYFKDGFNLSWFVGAQTASYLITVVLVFLLLFKQTGIPVLRWSPAFNKVMLIQSFPYALLILLMMLYNRIDAIMIERIHQEGKLQAGIYAQSYRILDAFVMFAMLFTNLLLPLFSRQIKESISPRLLLTTSSKLISTFAFIATVTCVFFPEDILRVFYTDVSQDSVDVFRCVILSFIPNCAIMLYGTLLTANGSMKMLNIYSFIGLIANILMNLFFIPWWGALGAAFATFLTQGLLAVSQIIYVHLIFRFSVSLPELVRYLSFIGLLILLNYGLLKYFNGVTSILISLLSSGCIAFLTRMISLKELLHTLKKENK